MRKYHLFVLCLKMNIEAYAPKAPKDTPLKKSRPSGILSLLLPIDFFLSHNTRIKDAVLAKRRNDRKIFIGKSAGIVIILMIILQNQINCNKKKVPVKEPMKDSCKADLDGRTYHLSLWDYHRKRLFLLHTREAIS